MPSHIHEKVAPLIKNNSGQTPRSDPILGAGDEGGQFLLALSETAEPRHEPDARTAPRVASYPDQKGHSGKDAVSESRGGATDVWVTAEAAIPFGEELSLGEAKGRARNEARKKAVEEAVAVLTAKSVDDRASIEALSAASVVGSLLSEQVLGEGVRQSDVEPGNPALLYVTNMRARVSVLRPESKRQLGISVTLNKPI